MSSSCLAIYHPFFLSPFRICRGAGDGAPGVPSAHGRGRPVKCGAGVDHALDDCGLGAAGGVRKLLVKIGSMKSWHLRF